MSRRSTTTQLLNFIGKVIDEVVNHQVVDCIYMDFAKAFDTVPHKRLLNKLSSYGICGKLHAWIKAFLTDRTQRVTVNGVTSEVDVVVSGIPQGSVLGPVLFIVYINDIFDNIKSEGFLFADDTKIFKAIQNEQDAAELQADIDELERWTNKWLLKFNPDKCHVLSMGRFEDTKYTKRYQIYSRELEHVFEEKDLGVIVDSDLSFEEHISAKVRIANAMVGLLRRSFSYLSPQVFRKLYLSLVRPHLEYAQTVWSPHSRKLIKMIELNGHVNHGMVCS